MLCRNTTRRLTFRETTTKGGPQFVRIYNRFACGDANVGCPVVPGIDTSGLDDVVDGTAEAEDAVGNEAGLIQLCGAVGAEVDKLAPWTPAPAARDLGSEMR